jgi:FixJ family two-component response regulator
MTKGTVFIIDDDKSVRNSLALFLISCNYSVETYTGSEDFLERESFKEKGCIVLDINLSGKSGLKLQEELLTLNSSLPVIFITGYGNIKLSVETLKKGAVNFLEKPFSDEDLLDAINEAMQLSQEIIEKREEQMKVQSLISMLTPRELDILTYLITGMLNKQIASECNIAEHTVKLHRHSISEKFGVKSLTEILRIADKAGIVPAVNPYPK